jgi:hypothetical protein
VTSPKKQKEWRDRNPEKVKVSRARWNAENAEKKATGRRRANLRRYGLTIETYDELLAKQDGVCGICGRADADSRGNRLAVDHDHLSGQVRGLLCTRCNKYIVGGHVHEQNVVNMIRYLVRAYGLEEEKFS